MSALVSVLEVERGDENFFLQVDCNPPHKMMIVKMNMVQKKNEECHNGMLSTSSNVGQEGKKISTGGVKPQWDCGIKNW